MPRKGQVITQGPNMRGKVRPHVWKSGPDHTRHEIYKVWLTTKAQASFRQESWQLDFEDFYNIWLPHWDNRGRKGTNVCLTRDDVEGCWSKDNVIIMTRREHIIRQIDIKMGRL